MNSFDYFFERTKDLNKFFVLAPEQLSFKDLFNNCQIFAQYLKNRIGTGKNIIIISPNSAFFVTVYLSVIKSGNIAVPLNHETEQNNLDFILDKCNPPLIFISSKIKEKLNFRNEILFHEDSLKNILMNESNRTNYQEDENFNSDSLAEIIFTSGSTGKPKGVMISHRNLISNTESIIEYLHLGPEEIMLVVLPFYYCYGLSLLHTHLRSGGSLVLNNLFIMLGGVINDLLSFKCTGFAGVPSHFQLLLRKSKSFKNINLPDLKYITQAGGKLHNAFINEFTSSFPYIKFIVMYGQTEATARLSWLPPEKLKEKAGSCGKAIPGVTLKIVDINQQPVNSGETGEIIASGDNIMLGYYGDAKATSETIRNGWLHTGDLGYMDDEGYLYLTARKNEIIKIGGRRVSPKEIEEVIVSLPEVVDCFISGTYDDILGESIKAVITINEKNSISEHEIRKYCSEKLASFKIPQLIILRNNILISGNGKKTIIETP